MSSTIYITRSCEFCSKPFTARTTVTRFCSSSCNAKAYKAKLRADKIDVAYAPLQPKPTHQRQGRRTLAQLCEKELLTVSETARYLGVSRPTVYGYLERCEIPSIRLGGKSFISRVHLLSMFDNTTNYKARPNNDERSMIELYSSDEIETRYSVKRTRIFQIARQYALPKVQISGCVYFDKVAVDRYFGEHHSEEKLYYTVDEATDRYGISRDALYKYIALNDLPKIQCGQFIKVSRLALDDLFNSLNKTL